MGRKAPFWGVFRQVGGGIEQATAQERAAAHSARR